ncbi:hypothetical protein PPL_05278 [Heterostelium album PN500]|uniref:Uncharacterized protein n=1 Tax=Heterostelium pallidum (strain ATCC 26659 / Pp 5 / PN500) TaxID=670386 RepID=D3BB92_HETP5|nr:hypothetical protein PPL_05278 [Heterostelium album PN500]EFA81299.1 hypothetical protein PPL_05278 [Heterostelium album PN500]|eukprot:XP_020433417.1 hypothetical protein PPL_05278 [Heterostelium album PN500]
MADAITQTIQNHFEFSKDSGTGAESMEQVFSQLNNTNNHHHHQHHHHQHHHHQQQQQNGITETSDDSSSTCSTSSYTSSNTGGGGGYLNGTTTSANTLTNIVPTVINLPSPTSSSPLQSKANNNQQQTQQQQQQQQQPSSATAVAASTAANTLTLIPTPKPYPLHEAAFKGEYDKIVSLLLFTQGKKVGSPNHQHSSSANHRQDGPIDTSKMDFTGCLFGCAGYRWMHSTAQRCVQRLQVGDGHASRRRFRSKHSRHRSEHCTPQDSIQRIPQVRRAAHSEWRRHRGARCIRYYTAAEIGVQQALQVFVAVD